MIHVVLYQPEIPPNTGNIMRTCAATNTMLHIIHPIGFSLEEKHLRRAAMDYYQFVNFKEYDSFEHFLSENNPKTIYFLTRYGQKNHTEIDYTKHQDVYFMFGRESTGIPKEILKAHLDTCLRIPMNNHVRSLNLANCVMVLVYEALRQTGFPDLSLAEPEEFKGKDWLEQ
jgi:rRNA methylase, putative, group 2